METYDTWGELVNKPNKTWQERTLIQCIATLSTQPEYSSNTPWEVYEEMLKYTQEIERMENIGVL